MPASGLNQFSAVAAASPNGGLRIAIPFDPDEVWGAKPRHPVTGTVNGRGARGSVAVVDGAPVLQLGPAWVRGSGIFPGTKIKVSLSPEGPQRGAMDPDIEAALDGEPEAARFFDGLAQFYRKGYLTWIAATKKRPEERARRIAATVAALKHGQKVRPRS